MKSKDEGGRMKDEGQNLSPAPSPALQKLGIAQVRDNVPDGFGVRAGGALVKFFGRRVLAAIEAKGGGHAQGSGPRGHVTGEAGRLRGARPALPPAPDGSANAVSAARRTVEAATDV